MEIGIIGFGRFGRFAADLLKQDFKVFVCDVTRVTQRPRGISSATFEEVAQKPIVILCVPISQMEDVCRRLGRYLVRGQLVLDTCSVKEKPLKMMGRLLPRTVEVVGTHPLFGPDSARTGLRGLKLVLCPLRCRRLNKIIHYLEQRGLTVIVTSAERHDREMAKTQALFHFLARAVKDLRIKVGALSTPGPARLFEDFEDVQHDSVQLFRDLQQLNRFAPTMRKRLIRAMAKIDRELN